LLGSITVRALACFQIALLGLTASRECGRYLAAWDRHESSDPLEQCPDPFHDKFDSPPR
jgi:hypothetical protein